MELVMKLMQGMGVQLGVYRLFSVIVERVMLLVRLFLL